MKYGSYESTRYPTYAKNFLNNQWYCFNDTSVSPAKESDIVTKHAHILVYQAIDHQ